MNVFDMLEEPFALDEDKKKLYDKKNDVTITVSEWGLTQSLEERDEYEDEFIKWMVRCMNDELNKKSK